jgi:hypothetical protein
MSPSELRNSLLYRDEFEEVYLRLPREVLACYISRPKNHEGDIRRWMFVRATLIALISVYLYWYYGGDSNDIVRFLAFVLVGYEVAYYSLRKDKNELDYTYARERYEERVNELICKLYPTWTPEL